MRRTVAVENEGVARNRGELDDLIELTYEQCRDSMNRDAFRQHFDSTFWPLFENLYIYIYIYMYPIIQYASA